MENNDSPNKWYSYIKAPHYISMQLNITVASTMHNLVLPDLDNPNRPITLSREPRHGDPVESWTIHTDSLLLICPKCRRPVSHPYQSYYKLDLSHSFGCECGQYFHVIWPDKTKDAQVTIKTYVDLDITESEEETEEQDNEKLLTQLEQEEQQ